ncbi:hypothetical protein FV226_26620 [Methylobacterium sp. WL12]|uniref:hypothetical protein n=1 Tax=Methylobacterium sp. WL12 TaxID=2603890 RepID=UPI0011CAD6FE|nr:hypothetical protein [Methylobacterium sp. WL12]TXM64345.1 hypothetical protein FV226_26620 [Methylobacterium sp. WL12]
MVGAATPELATTHNFETEEESTSEDRLRARRMRRVLNRPGRTTWLNIADRMWLLNQSPGKMSPPLDRDAADDLATRLEAGVASGIPPATLASSLRMREIRQGLGHALFDAFEGYPDADLMTVTVIYAGWSYTPAELERVTAAQVKAQFRRHLERAGVLKLPGPLFAVLHGEYEPTSGRYQLHFHLVTTEAKAAALKASLTATKIKGYAKTATGSVPVRRSRVRNRIGQLSYLVKGYWPSKPVIRIDGKLKRLRDHHRIPEPFGTQVLLWLDRQKFSDLVVMHDCWSRRTGGTAAMKALCLFVAGVG